MGSPEIRKLSAFKPFHDRRTDIVAYRGAMCNQKGCKNLHKVYRRESCKSRVGYQLLIIFKTDRRTLWLKISGIYPMVHWIKGELYAKNQGSDSRDEKVIWLLCNIRDIQTDTLSYRGAVCS